MVWKERDIPMQVVHSTCAGIDVHKNSVTVCLITRTPKAERTFEVRTYKTMTQDLLAMKDWLQDHHCKVVAMESTSVYWKPVYNLLEGDIEVMLVNPAHIKQVPGRKTDVGDSQWIAELLEHGLLKGSFIPPAEIRHLRDITRYRRRIIQERVSEVQRLQKTLEDCNIKLCGVATDIMGVSGRAILEALLSGEMTPEQMAELTRGRMRNKKKEMQAALEGMILPHHAWLLTRMLEHIDLLDESIEECEAKIDEMCRPFFREVELLSTIPGVEKRAAQEIIAEVGVDMSSFPDHRHFCSWAGMCPGNNESAGKQKNGHTRKANHWLKTILTQCAHAAARKKDCYLSSQYRRFLKKGVQKAIGVLRHTILEEIYFILRDKEPHRDLGADYFDKLNRDRTIKKCIDRLQRLGVEVQNIIVSAPVTDFQPA